MCEKYIETKLIKLENLIKEHEYISLKQLKKVMDGEEWRPKRLFYHYNWKEFIEDIKENGLKKNIKAQIKKGKYLISDGNHRAIALNYLHGKEYEVLVDIIKK